MSTLMFQGLSAYRHEDYGRSSTELQRLFQPDVDIPLDDPDRHTSLRIHVVADKETRVTLATGESLKEMKGSLTLQPSDEPRPIASADKTRKQIGYIQCLEAGDVDAQYDMHALIPRKQFEEIASALRHGQISLTIFADIEGFERSGEFDQTWDNKTKTYLPMVSVRFAIFVANFSPIHSQEREQPIGLLPATKADIASVTEATSKLTNVIQVRLNWIAWLVAAVAAFVLIRVLS